MLTLPVCDTPTKRARRFNAKAVAQNGRPPDPRATIAAELIRAGGNYLNPELVDIVIRVAQAQEYEAGRDTTLEDAASHLTVNATSLRSAVDETKLLVPDEFTDVSRLDRLPEGRRFAAKMKETARVFSNRASADRLSARIMAGKAGNRHRPI